MYGNESDIFWAASDWSGGDKHYERNMLKDCVKDDHMNHMAKQYPAAYLVNMCQLHYHAVAPLGSYLYKKDRGHWQENQSMCYRVLGYYDDHKDRGDDFLNEKICKIWAANAEGFHKNMKPDFEIVNSALNHGGCKYWRKSCKDRSKCGGYPEGY